MMMQRMQRAVALAATALLLAGGLAGCEPEQGGGRHNTKPRVDAGQDKRKGGGGDNPGGGAQPAPVQADPHAHNTQPGQVALFVSFRSESKQTPVCEWSKNGVSNPCANIGTPSHESDGWRGEWEHVEVGHTGDVFTINAQGTGAMLAIECEISWKGKLHGGTSNGRRCGIAFTLD